MVNDLMLETGIDIPFEEAQVIIHQPSIREIAFIGEQNFFIGCEFLRFSKDNLLEEDKARLENHTNFDVIVTLMKDNSSEQTATYRVCALMVLSLMFPEYQIEIKDTYIALKKDNIECKLNNDNYEQFLYTMNEMFSLSQQQSEYNPEGRLANEIADKLKRRKQQKAQNSDGQKISVFSRYISILSIGLGIDVNMLSGYTVYQLFDEFQRYQLKTSWDIYIQAKMAGAKDLKEVDDWMKDIHS